MTPAIKSDVAAAPMSAAIIGREITMSALREWAAALGGEAHQAVAVSSLGKWKTATQVLTIPQQSPDRLKQPQHSHSLK